MIFFCFCLKLLLKTFSISQHLKMCLVAVNIRNCVLSNFGLRMLLQSFQKKVPLCVRKLSLSLFSFHMFAAWAQEESIEQCRRRRRHNVSRVLKAAARSPSASPHGEKSVHTHQHISWAVNRTRNRERETTARVDALSVIHSLLLYCTYTVL